MIGRQNLLCDSAGVRAGFEESGFIPRPVSTPDGYAEPLFQALGARTVESIDASGYEGSTYVHDLNEPLPPDLSGRFTVVFDGGSLEHIFNFPQAIKNCMSAVAIGGHFVSITVCNNLVGHGFYQFSPEVLFRVLSPVNGFEMQLVMVRALHRGSKWRAVLDPEAVGRRVEMTNSWPTQIYVVARRVSLDPILATWPQQSDYTLEWATGQRTTTRALVDRLPGPMRWVAKVVRAPFGTTSGRGHFKTVKLSSL